ncbi:hypothetical protein NIES4073_36810 [Kalymmatonema gypsitolerans NIES-4073]|nr:hypothetical protein NIES4073_36810 [Scytonema sp. NIES-4073]
MAIITFSLQTLPQIYPNSCPKLPKNTLKINTLSDKTNSPWHLILKNEPPSTPSTRPEERGNYLVQVYRELV